MGCTGCAKHRKASRSEVILSGDPTRTITLRRSFVNDFIRRFTLIKRAATIGIIKNDCFDLDDPIRWDTAWRPSIDPEVFSPITLGQGVEPERLEKLYPPGYKEYAFKTLDEKLTAYLQWLNKMEQRVIYQRSSKVTYPESETPNWTDQYIFKAVAAGILSARRHITSNSAIMKHLGLTKQDISTEDAAATALINNRKAYADRLKSLSARVVTDLKGVVGDMNAQISRIISDGLLFGEHPRIIAKKITEKINTIGKHRATLIARTEVIRAHHLATIQTYRDFGIEGVSVDVEFNTAGDGRVCPICASLEGKIFTLDEIEGLIPVHPQCRCGALPALTEGSLKE